MCGTSEHAIASSIVGGISTTPRDANDADVRRQWPSLTANPPEGVKSEDWIKGGFKGAKC